MDTTGEDPDAVLAGYDDDARDTMVELDRLIRDCLPERSRRVWTGVFWGGTDQTIIGYGDLVQPRPRGPAVEWFIVGLARQSKHYSLYVNAAADGRYLLDSYARRLGKVKTGAASIGFARLDDIDLGVLAELLRLADHSTPPDGEAPDARAPAKSVVRAVPQGSYDGEIA